LDAVAAVVAVVDLVMAVVEAGASVVAVVAAVVAVSSSATAVAAAVSLVPLALDVDGAVFVTSTPVITSRLRPLAAPAIRRARRAGWGRFRLRTASVLSIEDSLHRPPCGGSWSQR
jgi:hypothetical protein